MHCERLNFNISLMQNKTIKAFFILFACFTMGCNGYSSQNAQKKSAIKKTPSKTVDKKTTPKGPTIQELARRFECLVPLHEKMKPPRPGDWLSQHKERGQTVDQYLADMPVRPGKRWTTIYLQPIGPFSEAQNKMLALTGEFLGIYFGVPVKIRKPMSAEVIPDKARRFHPAWLDARGNRIKQWLSSYILEDVLLPARPRDALVLFGFTATDLWPGQGWNFVYGQAALKARVSVQSLYRNGDLQGDAEARRRYLRRTLKTATHEMGHVVSIRHEIVWECNMCGSNNRSESDRHPAYLCPPNLAKVCWACGLEPLARFQKLHAFCKKHGLAEEAAYYRKAIAALKGRGAPEHKPPEKPAGGKGGAP